MNPLILACPSCAGGDQGGIAVALLIGGMILVPFAVFAIVVRVIRRAGS